MAGSAGAAAAAEEQLRQAEAFKAEGNRWYGQEEYRKALRAYHKVFCYVNGLPSLGDRADAGEEDKARGESVKRIKQTVRLNMAACYLKLEEHQKCVDACAAALELGPGCAKAHFRRGQARAALRDLAGARADLERARELAPDDAAIPAELRRLRAAASRGDAEERRSCARMLGEAASAEPAGGAAEGAEPAAAAEAAVCAASEAADAGGASEGAAPAAAASAAAAAASDGPAGSSAAPGGAAAAEGVATGGAGARGTEATLDEAPKLDFTVRSLTYSWQQTDEELKVYVPFDQSDELLPGVDESRVRAEFGEWSVSLVIRCDAQGRAPFGLRLGDFWKRLDPPRCRCTVRGSRVTLKLAKQVKEHWWNLLQHAPLHSG